MTEQIQRSGFTTINYVTKDGEHCTAAKNNGIVTIVSNKNGIRQLTPGKFMKEFIENLPKKRLENTPSRDTVTFSGNEETTTQKTTPEAPQAKENNRPSKTLKTWLAIAGAALIAAGIYFLTRGKGKSAAQKTAQELSGETNRVIPDTQTGLNNAERKVNPNVNEKPANKNPKAANETNGKDSSGTNKDTTAENEEQEPEVLFPDRIIIPEKPPKSNGKRNNKQKPQIIVLEDNIKPETPKQTANPAKKTEGTTAKTDKKPAETPKQQDSTQSKRMQQDDVLEQLKTQQDEIDKQNQQIIDDANNLVAALLVEEALTGGGKKAAETANDVIADISKKFKENMDEAAAWIEDVAHRKPADEVRPKSTDNLFTESVEDSFGLTDNYKSDYDNLNNQINDIIEDSSDSMRSDFSYNGMDNNDYLTPPIDDFNSGFDGFNDYGIM